MKIFTLSRMQVVICTTITCLSILQPANDPHTPILKIYHKECWVNMFIHIFSHNADNEQRLSGSVSVVHYHVTIPYASKIYQVMICCLWGLYGMKISPAIAQDVNLCRWKLSVLPDLGFHPWPLVLQGTGNCYFHNAFN